MAHTNGYSLGSLSKTLRFFLPAEKMPLFEITIFITVGILSGFINTAASSGSAITLPVMILLGIDPLMANGTNRLPIFIGFLTSVANYQLKGKIPWREIVAMILPIAFGAVLGALYIESLPRSFSDVIIGIALILSIILISLNSQKFLNNSISNHQKINIKSFLLFFIVGIWAGMIVLDSALFILFTLVLLMKYEFIEANIIKSTLVLVISIISILVFSSEGNINWHVGLLLSAGSVIGSYVGSNFVLISNSKIWIYRIIKLIILVELTLLILKSIPHLSHG
jgi:uncharacterized membrane protein YfcA